MTTRVLLIVVILVFLPVTATAQSTSDNLSINGVNTDDYPIVEVSVTVPTELADVKLSKEPFAITEDGRSVRPYLGVTEEEEAPAPQIVLAIDVSRSMQASIDRAKAAADHFLSSLPDGSQVAVVAFGATTDVLVESTADLTAVRTKIAETAIDSQTGTALNEAIQQAGELAGSRSSAPGSIVLLSDGRDDQRRRDDAVSQAAAINALRENDARLWAVQLPSSQQDPAALETLTGEDGRVLPAENADDLGEIYQGLASDLSREYVLRYESEASGETELAVTLDYANLHVEDSATVMIDASEVGGQNTASVTAINADSHVVTVPPLGTAAAFAAGVLSLTAASLVFWLAALLPRVRRPGERLIEYTYADSTGDRLTALARWTTDATDRRLRRGNIGARIDAQLESAGIDIRPGEFVVIVVSIMIVLGAIGLVIGGVLLGLLLAVLLPLATQAWLTMRLDRRQAAFSDQLTDVLQLIGGSLRAGYSLTQGIDAVSRDAEKPAATEFRRIIIEHRLGRDLNEAMGNCAKRMDNEDFSWVVQAIGIHREVGGDLARVLDNIVATIRDRANVHRQVRTLSAEGRMSARVLTALPILVLAALQFTTPDYLTPMFTNPLGIMLLAIAATLIVVGTLIIRRMTKIQY